MHFISASFQGNPIIIKKFTWREKILIFISAGFPGNKMKKNSKK